ncbi:MAG: hypothetical protein QMD05_07590 [Candidatus Brocadiaceae bacterium]|nr:hypothetical protein [Candidatus Brocadiaceae bacterium]
MKVLYYLGVFCLLLSGCVSEQWVRGYVQHELAGVKDIVTEEVYPMEKALTDVKTQLAIIIVEQKKIMDELQAIKEKESVQRVAELQAVKEAERSRVDVVSVYDKKWEEVEKKVMELEADLKKLTGFLEGTKELHPELVQKMAELDGNLRKLEGKMEGSVGDLQKHRLELIQIQTDMETINKRPQATMSEPVVAPVAPVKEIETHKEGEQSGIETTRGKWTKAITKRLRTIIGRSESSPEILEEEKEMPYKGREQ